MPAVAQEVRRWREHAIRIPDPAIRGNALSSIVQKRGHTDGAALFCIHSSARNPRLLRLLVAYQILWDFLDSVNEQSANCGTANGRHLHLALVEALDPTSPISDYYLYHPWHGDGGYLRSLVLFCRRECVRLPSYESVRLSVLREAGRAQVLALNHNPDATRRDLELRGWALREFPTERRASWFELTASASAGLTIFALLILAAKPSVSRGDIERVRRAYNPWISATATMLDSYVDQAEDEVNGEHSYVSHYPTGFATCRLGELVHRSTLVAAALPDGERHVVIVASMTAMYLSKGSAYSTAAMRRETRKLLRSGGLLPCLLLPTLRLWRAYHQPN